ncbi:type 1 glutamine amidotransferase [Aurantimonas sp. E1-2-R+4]|uniref:type 1 glutamine amidotransferase n=1 Tax=Aurantimonas sp. E1-2-R+4 TaxID=3113714 RepID=UPI002F95E5EA
MRVLVLQHERMEHPGAFRAFLEEDGHQWRAIQLQEGDDPPPFDEFDALWVMGGVMNVWEEDTHPWLRAEKALIREAVEGHGMPFLGICLGHQLLAEALGGACGPAETAEVGIGEVQLTEGGATGIFFDGVPERFQALQWHGAEVKQIPPGAKCLATSPACAVQAMQWGPRAYSLQFHAEAEPETARNWSAVPAYESQLEAALGPGGAARLIADCDAEMAAFNQIAERLYINWLQTAANA